MKRLFFYFFIIFILCFSIYPMSSFAGGKDYIERKIKKILGEPSLNGGKIGIYIKSLKNQNIIYDYNSRIGLTPASNMKVIVTSAALVRLGPEFRFETQIYGHDMDSKGNLESDLIIYSNGDPTYCVRFYKPTTKIFDFMAKKLYKQGIRTVKGDIIGDDSFFDRKLTGKGWKESYQLEPYSAQISPLSINENVVDVKIKPQEKTGLPGIVTLFPDADILKLYNKSKTSEYEQSIYVTREENTNNIIVSGYIPFNYEPLETYITVNDPALYTTSVFAGLLKNNGINVTGRSRLINRFWEKDKRQSYDLLLSHSSPLLPEILAYVNKNSDNLTAEILLKTLGHIYYGYGSSENGIKEIKKFLSEINGETKGFKMSDGSGLSPQNRVTAKLMVDILSYMGNSPYKKYFIDSLSIGGVDGTLKKRFTGNLVKGNVKAKTGSIEGVSALSGYVTTSYGQTLVFSILIYNIPEWTAKDTENRIVRILASCPGEL